MADHIDTDAERDWLDKLPRNNSSFLDLLRFAHEYLGALDAERERAEKAEAMLDHTQQWYAERVRKIEDVAKRAGIWPEIAAILANGTATRQMPDGSFFYDPPTYAQQLNIAKHRAEKAEAERDQALARLAAPLNCDDGALYQAMNDSYDRYEDFKRDVLSAFRPDHDAEAALQRVVDAAREELVRDLLARHEAEMSAKFRNPADHTSKWTQAANAIRALKRPEASHE